MTDLAPSSWSSPAPGTPRHPRVRALTLLLIYLAGCALVAAALAAGLGAVWQELFGWAQPYVTPR